MNKNKHSKNSHEEPSLNNKTQVSQENPHHTCENNDNLSENNLSENDIEKESSPSGEELQDKLTKLNDDYLRLHAEFDNYRKRTLKEKTELLRSGSERVLIGILPVVDDFERALQNMTHTDDANNPIAEGVELIYNKFISFLKKNGVEAMQTNGQPFNAEIHEALTMVPATNENQKNTIVDTIEKGYTLDGKVIRFPKVVVAQ